MTRLDSLVSLGFPREALIAVAEGKKGGGHSWDGQTVHPDSEFEPNENIAWLNGAPVDIDLDHPLAVQLARHLLPETLTYGRDSNPESHYVYLCSDGVPTSVKYNDILEELDEEFEAGKTSKCNVELRCGPRGYSLLPPSWLRRLDGSRSDYRFDAIRPMCSRAKTELANDARLVAVATYLARHWDDIDHDQMGHILGYLLRRMTERELEAMLKAICTVLSRPQSERDDVGKHFRDTVKAFNSNRASGGVKLSAVWTKELFDGLAAHFPTAPSASPRALVISGADMITPQVTDWLWQDYMPLGALGLHSGRENLGKTLTALDKAAQITRGTLPGIYHGTPKRVLIAASEDDWATTIVPRLMAANADLKLIGRIEVKVGDSVQEVSLPVDIDDLREYIVNAGDVALVLLDPLMSRLDGKLDTHKDASVRQALEPLSRLAQDANVTVLGIIHVNKTQTNDPLTAIMGSRAFVAVSRFVFATVQDPNDESQSLLGQVKCNVGAAKRETHAYTVESIVVAQDAKGRDITAPRVQWKSISPRSIRSYFEEAQDKATVTRKAESLSEVTLWLSDFLAKQPGQKARAGMVIAQGASAGHSEKKLRNAAALLKIDIVPIPGSFPRASEWVLSATSCPVTF